MRIWVRAPLRTCLIALCVRIVQAVAEGVYTQVVVAMADARRRSPTSSEVAKGLFDAEKLGRSFVSLTRLCDEVGTVLIGDQCSPCPSGASCPGAGPRPKKLAAWHLRHSHCSAYVYAHSRIPSRIGVRNGECRRIHVCGTRLA